MLPNNDKVRKYVADIIRRRQPTYVITHWRNSTHKDHANTHAIVVDALWVAELEAVESGRERSCSLSGRARCVLCGELEGP